MNKNRTTTLLTIFLLSNLISFALIGQTLIIPEEEIFIEEFSRSETPQVRLPNRNGGFEFFETVRSDIFEEGFARKFPTIESYKVFSKKSGIFGRIISVENSIHAFLFDGKGYYAIEKNLQGDYILSDKDRRHPDDKFICSGEIEPEELEEELKEQSNHFRGPEDLRVFRIAVASSGEFTKGRFGQSSVSQVQAVIAARIYKKKGKRSTGGRGSKPPFSPPGSVP